MTSEINGLQTHGNRRRFVVAGGGLVLAVVLLAAGAVFKSNADFANRYVSRQLAEQRIRFPAMENLAPEEQATPCLVRYAGQALTSGPQAECYANHFIGRHLKLVAGGKVYSEMRAVQTSLREKIATAQASNDPAVADLQRELAEVTGKRQALFEGESTRGMLLTSFGFSTLGAKAGQAATAAHAGAAVVFLATLVLLVHTGLRHRPAATGGTGRGATATTVTGVLVTAGR